MLEMIVGDVARSQARQPTDAGGKLRYLVLPQRQRRDVLQKETASEKGHDLRLRGDYIDRDFTDSNREGFK